MEAAKTLKPKKKVQRAFVYPNVVFPDKEGHVKEYIKKFLGEGTKGRIGDTTSSTGKLTKLMGGSIGVRRLVFLALYSLETQIDNGEIGKDQIIEILTNSKVSIF